MSSTEELRSTLPQLCPFSLLVLEPLGSAASVPSITVAPSCSFTLHISSTVYCLL